MTEEFLRSMYEGDAPESNLATLRETKKLVVSGLFPFSLSTRFQFRSLKAIERSKKIISLAKVSRTPLELLELFCFDFFSERWPNNYASLKSILGKDIDSILSSYVDEWSDKWGTDTAQDALTVLVEEHPLEEYLQNSAPYTSSDTVSNMVSELPPEMKPVIDPFCGYGEFLLAAKNARMSNTKHLSEKEIIENISGIEKCQRRAFITGALIDPKELTVPNIFVGDPITMLGNPMTARELKDKWVLGNFPFKEQTGKKGSATKDLSGIFVKQILDAEPEVMLVVLPEKKNKSVVKRLFDGGLRKYKILGRSAFPDICLDTCYVLCERGYKGPTEISDYRGSNTTVKKGEFLPNDIRATALFQTLQGHRSLEYRFNGAGGGASSGVHSYLVKELEIVDESHKDSVEVILTPKITLRVSVSALKKVSKRDPKFGTKAFDHLSGKNQHKLVLGSAASRTALGNLKVVEYDQVCGWTGCRLNTDSKEESANLKTYLETKFVKALVRALKTATANTKTGIFRYIPDVDLSIEWTDKELYRHFKLTEADIDLVGLLTESS